MRLATMWNDVLPSLFRRPVTERYPAVRRLPPARLRALPEWDREQCTGCGMCATDCPSQAIDFIVLDKKAKRFVFRFHTDRCTFCAQCTYSCNKGALNLRSENWELAALDRQSLALTLGEPEDVRQVLEGRLPQPAAAEKA